MANDASEVFVAANGHIYVGATSATAPTDATSNPGAGWSDLGYCTEDGVTLAPGQTVTDVMVWQEFYPLKRIPTAKSFEVSFTLAQLNSETLALALGGGVSAGSGGTYTFTPATAQTLDERSMIVDTIDGTRIYRFYIPTGIVINLGQITFNRQSIVSLPITFGATASGTADPFSTFIEDDEYPVGSGELAS